MNTPLIVNAQLTIPPRDLEWTAVRAGGPGGQNVNKVSSKVELRFDLAHTTALADDVRNRLRALARNRLDADGRILVVSQLTRDQNRNLEDALDKIRVLVLEALERPATRHATRPSRRAKARRVADKRHHAAKKQSRRGGGDE